MKNKALTAKTWGLLTDDELVLETSPARCQEAKNIREKNLHGKKLSNDERFFLADWCAKAHQRRIERTTVLKQN
jgi:hypothetical protein